MNPSVITFVSAESSDTREENTFYRTERGKAEAVYEWQASSIRPHF